MFPIWEYASKKNIIKYHKRKTLKNSVPYFEDIQLFSFFCDCPCKYYMLWAQEEDK